MNLDSTETSIRIKERNACSLLTVLEGVRLATQYLVMLVNAAEFWQSSRGSCHRLGVSCTCFGEYEQNDRISSI